MQSIWDSFSSQSTLVYGWEYYVNQTELDHYHSLHGCQNNRNLIWRSGKICLKQRVPDGGDVGRNKGGCEISLRHCSFRLSGWWYSAAFSSDYLSNQIHCLIRNLGKLFQIWAKRENAAGFVYCLLFFKLLIGKTAALIECNSRSVTSRLLLAN